jgi:hypothetical protein
MSACAAVQTTAQQETSAENGAISPDYRDRSERDRRVRYAISLFIAKLKDKHYARAKREISVSPKD